MKPRTVGEFIPKRLAGPPKQRESLEGQKELFDTTKERDEYVD